VVGGCEGEEDPRKGDVGERREGKKEGKEGRRRRSLSKRCGQSIIFLEKEARSTLWNIGCEVYEGSERGREGGRGV
jgi:hypothetical protein